MLFVLLLAPPAHVRGDVVAFATSPDPNLPAKHASWFDGEDERLTFTDFEAEHTMSAEINLRSEKRYYKEETANEGN
jgi:hypothetical protein